MRNKKLLIIMIIIIIALICATVGFTFAYAKTDFLKSNTDLFYKYLSQTLEKVEGFENKDLENYLEKSNKTPYEESGKLSVEVASPNIDKDMLEKINKVNLSYVAKTDKTKSLASNSIRINYSDNISFPIEYRQTDDIFAITSNLILKDAYIGIQNKDIDKFLEKLGVTDIKNLETKDELLSNSEIAIDNAKLKEIINNNISKENFSKENDAYVLTLDREKAINIIELMLNEIKESNLSKKELSTGIDSILENIEELEFSALKITVDKNNKIEIEFVDLVKINIGINNNQLVFILSKDEIEITLKVTKSDQTKEPTYRVELDIPAQGKTMSLYFNVKYSNLEAQKVDEKYYFGILLIDDNNTEISYDYTFEKTKSFSNALEIDKVTTNNVAVLNDSSEEFIATLAMTLFTEIGKINAAQMQQLGLSENQNILLYTIPTEILSSIITSSRNNNIVDDNLANDLGKAEAEAFNQQFKLYEGMRNGSATKTLVQKVISSNEAHPENIVSVNGEKDKEKLEAYVSTLQSSRHI